MLALGQSRISVLANDVLSARTQLVAVTQPAMGSVRVDGNELVVDLPANLSTPVSFTYTIKTGGSEEVATVQLSPQPQLRWATGDPTFVDPNADATPERAGLRERLAFLGQPPPLWLTLTDLDLPLLPILWALSPVFVALALRTRLKRNQQYFTLSGIRRRDQLTLTSDESAFTFRHDAGPVWATGLRRKPSGDLQIETPNGYAWVSQSNITLDDSA